MSTSNTSATGNVKSTAQELGEAARERAEAEAQVAQDRVAMAAESEAQQIRDAGSAFEAGSFARGAADQLADSLTHAATAVRDADFQSMQEDLTAFARRNPLLFFGGAALLGFVATRALKASERHGDKEPDAPAAPQVATRSAIPEVQGGYPEQTSWRYGQ
ncbi:hypothetical protein ACFORG_19925 [Lutimaribacter marinistellae]|uniref:DUF3618 domain-containing protein n=1 Tax=Lutimaribacter marinistellae TaxID=1820329 RepID=A0ABV7TK62_9RHOB